MDTEDAAAVSRFDKKRKGRKTSNKDWYNPDDSDAKVGRTKDGACDMVYKPEHTVDLDSGAIIAAEVRPGDAGDTEGLAERIIGAAETVEDLHGKEHAEGSSHVKSLTADKGYFAAAELAIIQEETGARAVVGDPNAARRKPENMTPEERKAVERAARAVKSKAKAAKRS